MCIKFCFSFVFLAIFASAFAGDNCNVVLKECDEENVEAYFMAALGCYADKTTCIEGQETTSEECKTCYKDKVLETDNEWCKCVNIKTGLNEAALQDEEKFKTARGNCLTFFGTGICSETVKELKSKHEKATAS